MIRDADRIATAAGGLAERPVPLIVKSLAWYANHYLALLEHHHHSKDDIVWPLIAASAGDAVDLEKPTEDHRALDALIATVRAALNDLVDAPLNGPAANTLAAATARLRDELTEHLTAEDRDILPVIEQFVTIRDLDKADRRIKRTAPLHALLFLVAWLNSIAEPHERRAVPLRFLLPLSQRRYQRHTHTALTDGGRRETAATADIDYTGFPLAHHSAEDSWLWPTLRQRAPDARPALDRLEAQHGHLGPLIAAAGDRSLPLRARARPRRTARGAQQSPRRGGAAGSATRRGAPRPAGVGRFRKPGVRLDPPPLHADRGGLGRQCRDTRGMGGTAADAARTGTDAGPGVLDPGVHQTQPRPSWTIIGTRPAANGVTMTRVRD